MRDTQLCILTSFATLFLGGYCLMIYFMFNDSIFNSMDILGKTNPSNDYNKLARDYQKLSMDSSVVLQEKNAEIFRLNSLLISKQEIDTTNYKLQSGIRPGVIILGMHRSGTSVVGGLVNKMGLKTGGPLIEAAEDNAKGFFERIDVVLQNDYIMKRQGIHYAYRTHMYDTNRALKDILTDESGTLFGHEGKQALAFLNKPVNYPWMLKDPRLCITLRTWLPLLNFIPAILFTYRNPMDVGLSMNKRNTEHFAIGKGVKLWYVYNKRAIQQSQDLCRVVTSHRLFMQQPEIELKNIYDGLLRCGVNVPREVTQSEINEFVDKKLQHGHSTQQDKVCSEGQDYDKLELPSSWVSQDPFHVVLYRASVKAYCDMESGVAFEPNYKWNEEIKDE